MRTTFRYRELRPLLTFSEELWFSPAHEYRVHDVAASVAAGLPSARIRVAYGLTGGQIEVAVHHAPAYPLLDDLAELRMLREGTALSRRIKKRKSTT
jgi:hypothetical protein